jgi:cellulose synthase/poly-beta-1,6-N-acetylglucosamine synthase-like glycosyltransferase
MALGEIAFLIVYFSILVGLSFYGSHRYHMAWLYHRHKRDTPQPPSESAPLPHVTIQLPLYNERYVTRRLVDHVCRIRYPGHLLEIQVLDDSTDDTVEIARAIVAEWKARGVDIVHLHRTDRTGFKAGALQAGMQVAKGEFIAVFDADFTPAEDFLERTVPYFTDPGVGMVQARWSHINRRFSLLTRAQSVLLDGHFIIEHTARNRSGRFFNFNGTAGIWRRSTIADAGGWEHDTLTEDLDLSYRAQIKGWRFVFLNDLLAPAELPVDMAAFKNQQHRWAKGSIQVALKLLPRILRSDLSHTIKFEAFVHLTNNVAYVMMVVLSLMMPLSLHLRVNHGLTQTLLIDVPFFMGATVSIIAFYLLAQSESGETNWYSRLLTIPVVLGLGIGLALNNTKATLEALLGHESPFVRTPKLAVEGDDATTVKPKRLYQAKRDLLPLIELSFGLLFTYTVWFCIHAELWLALPFMLLFQFGYLYIGLLSLFQWSRFSRSAA